MKNKPVGNSDRFEKKEIARYRGEIPNYNLNMIISLGYRVKSRIVTNFRRWATECLKEYMIKGFTMDDERLKNLGEGNYWKQLLDRIRDIRSSEKVMYRQVLDLHAASVDYKPKSSESIAFLKWFKINCIMQRMGIWPQKLFTQGRMRKRNLWSLQHSQERN